jgi:urea transport system ATP-binding protein
MKDVTPSTATIPDGGEGFAHVLEPGKLDTSHGVMLYLDGVNRSFDGFKAINNLSLSVDVGELRTIIGPNGAGKTTMMDIITGKTRPDSGTVFFGQTMDLTKMTEPEIAQAGIGRKFQKPTVFAHHTVFENLELAIKSNRGIWHSLFGKLSGEQRARIDEILETIQLTTHINARAGLLSHGQKQWLEIGMLLAQEPKLLLLDEPVAGMTDHETERTAELLKSIEGKHSIVVVEHDMEFVNAIAHKVTVLHEGSVLAEGSMESIQNNEKVIEVYLGR